MVTIRVRDLPAVTRWSRFWAERAERLARDKASGKILESQTGELVRSIEGTYHSTGFEISSIFYGVAHDLGFTRKPYTVVPTLKKALKFEGKRGETVFSRKVSIPTTVFPSRPIFLETIDELAHPMSQDLASRLGRDFSEEFQRILDIQHKGDAYSVDVVI